MPVSEQLRIAIRVDASAEIGTGHLQRMLALAGALRDGGAAVQFVTRSLGLACDAPIAAKGFDNVAMLDAPDHTQEIERLVPHSAWAAVSWERDIADTKRALEHWSPDWVIIDSYAFDARWHRAVRQALGAHIAVVDDLADRPLAASILIDHNFHPDHRKKYAGWLADKAAFCTGPEFAMIDTLYADAPRYRFCDEVRSIGIFMGGIDAGGHTLFVLDALDEIGWRGPVEIASTSANAWLAQLRARAGMRENTSLTLDQPNLTGFFARHDLQIGAGGGATWERCSIGAPTIALICAENQRLNVPHLARAGILAALDMLANAKPPTQTLAQAIASLIAAPAKRAEMHKLSKALVDGQGVQRVADAIFRMSQTEEEACIRPQRGIAT